MSPADVRAASTPPTVLLSGATGFLGRAVALALRGRGYHVRGLVRGSGSPGTENVAWDLEAAGDPTALAGATTLVHAAAYVPRSMTDPNEALRCWTVNALGTSRLLEAAVHAGVEHIVYVSSGNVYRPQPRAVAEDDPLYPSARAPYYLSSKLCGEVLADHFDQSGRARVAIARPSAIFGPGMVGAGLVPIMARKLRAAEAVVVQHGGRYQVDLVYVDDVADGIARMVDQRAGGAFNLGSGAATTSLELAHMLVESVGAPQALLEVQGDLTSTAPSGFSALDITRARRELGYAPRPLRVGLRTYLESLDS
jgi:UDP-glucose 4-epimerase